MAEHILSLRYSDDGGNTWSDWQQYDVGDTGSFENVAKFTRLGSFQHSRIFEIETSSPRDMAILGGVMIGQECE